MEHEKAVHNLAVEGYLLGEMNNEERDAFESHYFECAVCAEDLCAASKFVEDTRDILGAERPKAAPARIGRDKSSSWNWLGWLQPQLAAAAIGILAVVAGVESLGTIPGLRHRLEDVSAPRIVNSTVLHSQTRGLPTTLKTVSGEPAVFVFDLPESPASDLQFIVRATDGREVFRLSGKAPPQGEPVTLSIPRLDLAAGAYTLVVKTSTSKGQAEQELGQYPFEVSLQ